MLRTVLDEIGPWRLFFGSDGPILNGLCPLKKWVNAVREPELNSCAEIFFTTKEKEIMLGKAVASLLNLEIL